MGVLHAAVQGVSLEFIRKMEDSESLLRESLNLLVRGERHTVTVDKGREQDFAELYLILEGFDYTSEDGQDGETIIFMKKQKEDESNGKSSTIG